MSDRQDRLYNLLPAIYRMQDADQGEPLRALLQVISEQLNLVEDDIAQLYENWFIETADDWAVPYIGDLVGYQPVHAGSDPLNASDPRAVQRGKILVPRRDVANTLRYRSQKGTLALLELLSQDVAGWPARAVEFYQLLGASQSLNFIRPQRGGTLSLRDGATLDSLDGPFDLAAHTVDVRRITSATSQGLMNLSNVGLFVWRLRNYPVTAGGGRPINGRPPNHVDRRAGRFTFSSLGNDCPLFTLPEAEADPTGLAEPLNVPAPIRRRALQAHKEQYYGPGKSFCLYRRTQRSSGRRGSFETLLEPIPVEQITVANLSDWFYRPSSGQVAVDPERGRIAFPPREMPDDLLVHYYYGFSADIGGGEYHRALAETEPEWKATVTSGDRSHRTPLNDALSRWVSEKPLHAVIEIADSGIYSEQINIVFDEQTPGQTLELRAADRCFPVLRLLNVLVNQSDDLSVTGGPGNCLNLSGLLIACRGVRVNGDLDQVCITHSTLVPGWELDSECTPCCGSEPSLTMIDAPAEEEVPAASKPGTKSPSYSSEQAPQQPAPPETPARPPRTTRLIIRASILGSIQVIRDAVRKEPLQIELSDSILDATDPEFDALSTPDGTVAHAALTITRCTVIGEISTHAIILGENSIFYSPVRVARRQIGCMRFSYIAPDSRTPRRFNCQPDLVLAGLDPENEDRADGEARVAPRFNSLRYGTPVYCQLANDCAGEIKQGAEDESEMGVFHDLYQPQRLANLQARLDDYTPASTQAGIIFVS
jgi:hypothetical protein